MPIEQIKTLIIGGGQAGLTMSHRLKQRGLAHLVLERGRIGERWRSERWDGPEFQYYGHALQAAADGLGVAMGIRPYIDDDLAAGRLVAPFALTVPKGMRWYLVYRSFQTGQRDFAAFRRWIIRAAAGPAARGKGKRSAG